MAKPDSATLAALKSRLGVAANAPGVASPKTGTASPATTGSSWVETFLTVDAKAASKLAEIERGWGKGRRAGSAVTFQRDNASGHHELEIDASTGLPTRRAVAHDSSQHVTQYLYEHAAGGVTVHRGTHTEARLGKTASILDVEYANIHLEKRRARQ
jgi:hypothetical protein